MTPIERVLERLKGVKKEGTRWKALCPAHDDRQPSLSIGTGRNHQVLLNCFAGCTFEQVLAALDLKAGDLHPEADNRASSKAGAKADLLTVDKLAANKKLPAEFLRSLGLKESRKYRGAIEVPYLDATGSAGRSRLRSALKAKDGSSWSAASGDAIVPYGLWRLNEARSAGLLLIVEGESDCWTLWHHGLPAIGIPGADMVKVLDPTLLDGIRRIFVVQEPDKAGASFVRSVRAQLLGRVGNSAVYPISTPRGAKDPNDLHQLAPDQFRPLFDAELAVAPLRPTAVGGAGRPRVVVRNAQLHKVATDAYAALLVANEPPRLFNFFGRLSSVVCGAEGRPSVRTCTESELRRLLSEAADFTTSAVVGKGSDVFPPTPIASSILSQHAFPGIPALKGVIETPTLRPDGSLLSKGGYDQETGLILAPLPSFSMPDVPVQPSSGDVQRAIGCIEEMVRDFPLKDQASYANTFALILTAIIRHAISGNTPLALIDAPQPGTGKSLLAEVISVVATGRPAGMMTAPGDEDEWRKKITTRLMTGSAFIVIDNVVGRLDSAQLCTALTTSEWRDRQLGGNSDVVLPQRATWLATGNNIRTGADLARRCYWIRLDARMSRPWSRNSFHHPDLTRWVSKNRGALVSAVLTLAMAWIDAGKPAWHGQALGGFEEWSSTIGGILSVAGIDGFLGNLDEMHSGSDEESGQWETFLRSLHERFGDEAFRVGQVCELLARKQSLEILPESLAEAWHSPKGLTPHRIARAIAEHDGRHFGLEDQFFLERPGADSHAKVARWRVRRIPSRNSASLTSSHASTSFPDAVFAGGVYSDSANTAPASQVIDRKDPIPAEFDPATPRATDVLSEQVVDEVRR